MDNYLQLEAELTQSYLTLKDEYHWVLMILFNSVFKKIINYQRG